jgi:hypothetical protein
MTYKVGTIPVLLNTSNKSDHRSVVINEGRTSMSTLEERVLIYTALAVVCAFAGVFVGFWIGAMAFMQVAMVIEALFWVGLPKPGAYRPREHRTLFN